MATVYELIQELVEYPPDTEVRFKVGGLTGDSWNMKFYNYPGHEKNIKTRTIYKY